MTGILIPARLCQSKTDGTWIIIDAGKQTRTGFDEVLIDKAEEALGEYFRIKTVKEFPTVNPSKITVDEVLFVRSDEGAGKIIDHARRNYAVKLKIQRN